MKLRLYLLDRNTQWEVTRTDTIMTDTPNLEELDYQLLDIESFAVYEYISTNLKEGKYVYIPKYLEGDITVDNVVVMDTENDLILFKRTCITKIKDYIYNTRINLDVFFDMYKFIVLNDWMISKGFVITDENREEKYLEIITSISEIEDETVAEGYIQNLEVYLNLKDKLAVNSQLLINMDNTISNIVEAETSDEVSEYYDLFMSQFN